MLSSHSNARRARPRSSTPSQAAVVFHAQSDGRWAATSGMSRCSILATSPCGKSTTPSSGLRRRRSRTALRCLPETCHCQHRHEPVTVNTVNIYLSTQTRTCHCQHRRELSESWSGYFCRGRANAMADQCLCRHGERAGSASASPAPSLSAMQTSQGPTSASSVLR